MESPFPNPSLLYHLLNATAPTTAANAKKTSRQVSIADLVLWSRGRTVRTAWCSVIRMASVVSLGSARVARTIISVRFLHRVSIVRDGTWVMDSNMRCGGSRERKCTSLWAGRSDMIILLSISFSKIINTNDPHIPFPYYLQPSKIILEKPFIP